MAYTYRKGDLITMIIAVVNRRRYIVMDIGCLECWHDTKYVGAYASVADAKAKHPTALTVPEQESKGWHGECALVIFDTHSPQQ